MISDTLAEALWEMQRYLNDPAFSQTYSGTLRTEIERVMEAMEYRCAPNLTNLRQMNRNEIGNRGDAAQIAPSLNATLKLPPSHPLT